MAALYDTIGKAYADYRRPDPRIAAAICKALGEARTIMNIGAGTGSYEPADRDVVAVELSETMIRQRPRNAAPVVQASALQLPFADDAFETSLASFTIHHWPDQLRGLREMARVALRAVIFTWEPTSPNSWLMRDYFPEIFRHDLKALPPVSELYPKAFGHIEVLPVPIPHDCIDGFLECYWRRPEMYFDAGARAAISPFAKGIANTEAGLARLRKDLDDGTWHRRNGHLLALNELDLGYRLVLARR
jgi:SAM-dependent methyltransferase